MGDAISLVIEEIEHGLRESASSDAVHSLGALGHEDARVLGQVLAGYLNKYVTATVQSEFAEASEVLAEAFRLELTDALNASSEIGEEFFKVGALDLSASCRAAARNVLAPLLWSQAVGDRWDTTQVSQFLDVTRQAIHKRVVGGSILGIPGEHTTWFPVWQFDIGQRRVRPEVRDIVSAFRGRLGADVDPLVIATWATTPQPEDLDSQTPAEWLEGASFESDPLVVAAQRAAARLAQ